MFLTRYKLTVQNDQNAKPALACRKAYEISKTRHHINISTESVHIFIDNNDVPKRRSGFRKGR
jgi:hypothetical protein